MTLLATIIVPQSVITPNWNTSTFSNIPQGFQHLRIIGTLAVFNDVVANNDLIVRFNGDTAANYDWQLFTYDNGAITPGFTGTSGVSDTSVYLGRAGDFSLSPTIFDVPCYSNTTTYKTIKYKMGTGSSATSSSNGIMQISNGTWRNTAAITSITIAAKQNTATSYSQGIGLDLYGY